MTILLVEDEPNMAGVIVDHLRHAGFVVDNVDSLNQAFDAVKKKSYDLMVLDRRLPDGDGLDFVPEIKTILPEIRVLILSALDSTSDKVAGLDAGADDYLAKPFESEELLARVRATLRRPWCQPIPPILVGAVAFDCEARQIFVHDRTMLLHSKELALLEALMRRANKVVPRDVLISDIYGLDADVLPNALDVLVCRLRKRLLDVEAGVTIHSARGVGYLLTEASSQ
jgi:two-component system, OmpR family, response regulator